MRLIKGFHVRHIADEVIAVPTGEVAGKLSGLVTMNETGLFLFDLLKENQTQESLVQALVAEYEVSPDKASKDVSEFLEILRAYNLLLEE